MRTDTHADSASSPRIPRRWRALLLPAGTVVAACAGAALILAADPSSQRGFPLPPCPLHWLFGLDCPGCGGTRMVFSLLRGDLAGALHYNAVALAFTPFFLWTWGAWVLGRWRGRRVLTWEHWRWSPAVGLTVLAVWTVVRNLPFEPFRSLWV